jgi:putative restriction endonuclease
MPADSNDQIRAAAGQALRKMIQDKGDNVFTWSEIDKGFEVNGSKVHFATKAAGIFKPRELADGAALSIKQVKPSRPGRAAPYDDKDLEDGVVSYQLQKAG